MQHNIDFEQHDELQRVTGRIGQAVLDFCRTHAAFHGDDLTEYVKARCGGSAESARRVMRDLRAKGLIEYRNTSRSSSFYEIDGVAC